MNWMQSKLSALRFLFSPRITIRAVIIEDGDLWAIQGLEYDIAAQGASVPEAMESFGRAVVAQVTHDLEHGRVPFQGVPQAPDPFWEMFARGVEVRDPETHKPPTNVPPRFNQELRLCA